jgi:hypothetical protein
VNVAIAPGAGEDTSWAMTQGIDGSVVLAGICDMDELGDFDFCVAMLEGSGTIPQYVNGATDWDAGSGFFGACLRNVGAGAVDDWTTTGACNANDDDLNWYGIPTAMTKVAHAPTDNAAATATFNFGVKVSTTQSPGTYTAPITFEVLAPDA